MTLFKLCIMVLETSEPLTGGGRTTFLRDSDSLLQDAPGAGDIRASQPHSVQFNKTTGTLARRISFSDVFCCGSAHFVAELPM